MPATCCLQLSSSACKQQSPWRGWLYLLWVASYRCCYMPCVLCIVQGWPGTFCIRLPICESSPESKMMCRDVIIRWSDTGECKLTYSLVFHQTLTWHYSKMCLLPRFTSYVSVDPHGTSRFLVFLITSLVDIRVKQALSEYFLYTAWPQETDTARKAERQSILPALS